MFRAFFLFQFYETELKLIQPFRKADDSVVGGYFRH